MLKLIAKEITWDCADSCPIELPTEVEFENPTVAQLCDYFTREGIIAETLSERYDWGVNSLKLVLEDTHSEDTIVKPIYVLEGEFMDRFDDALHEIKSSADEGDPLTLGEILGYGFNNIYLNGKRGYEKEDFTVDELQTKVTWSDWDRDSDGYRYVILKEVVKSENKVVEQDTFTITCYNTTETFPESERQAQIREYRHAMLACEGSERDRYTNIYLALVEGKKVCKDEEDW